MASELISGLFGLAGVIVGSASSLFTAILVNRLNKKRRIYGEALDQIIGYWNLEEEMAKHIHTLENKSRSTKTIKEDFRLMVYTKKGIRPTMTESDANRYKKMY